MLSRRCRLRSSAGVWSAGFLRQIPARLLQRLPVLPAAEAHFSPPHRLHGVVDVGDDVEFVEDDRGLAPDVFLHPGDVGRAHVHGGFGDRPGMTIVLFQGFGKCFPGALVFARHRKEHAFADEVAKDAEIAMAFAHAHLVAPHTADVAPVRLRIRRREVRLVAVRTLPCSDIPSRPG